MSEPGDYQLDPFEERGTIDLADEVAASRRRWPWLVAAVVLLLVAGWIYWQFFRGEAEAPVASPAAAAAPESTAPVAEFEETVDLPVLADSDGWVRDVVGQLSAYPRLATWLLNDYLIQRLVATVDNLAAGKSPKSHVSFLGPKGDFEVVERGGKLLIDPASYARYDALVGVVESLHVEGTARVYRNVKPLLDQAYSELGYPDGDFDAALILAVKLVLATPVVEQAEVEAFASSYKYADPRLEALNDAQKHLLRLGPENLATVQNRLRRIAQRAGLELD